MMRRRWLLFGIYLLACTTFTWGQLPVVPGTEEPERPSMSTVTTAGELRYQGRIHLFAFPCLRLGS